MKQSSKTAIIVVATFIIAFAFGMEYKAAQLRSAFTEGLGELDMSFDSEDSLFDFDEPVDEKVVIEGGMGEKITLSTMNVKVNSFEEADTVTASFGSATPAGSGAKFVVIDLDLTNTGKEPFSFYNSEFNLMDETASFYDPADSVGVIDNYISVRDLAPNIPENGKMLFKVPESSTDLKLVIDNKGENEVYHVGLR